MSKHERNIITNLRKEDNLKAFLKTEIGKLKFTIITIKTSSSQKANTGKSKA